MYDISIYWVKLICFHVNCRSTTPEVTVFRQSIGLCCKSYQTFCTDRHFDTQFLLELAFHSVQLFEEQDVACKSSCSSWIVRNTGNHIRPWCYMSYNMWCTSPCTHWLILSACSAYILKNSVSEFFICNPLLKVGMLTKLTIVSMPPSSLTRHWSYRTYTLSRCVLL